MCACVHDYVLMRRGQGASCRVEGDLAPSDLF